MIAGPEDIGGLEEIFEHTARAVVAGQAALEKLQPPSAGLVPSSELVYSIPRVAVDLVFGLEVTAKRRVLLKRRRPRQAWKHHLRFAFLAGPRPPPPPPPVLEQVLWQPDFFLPGEQQQAVKRVLEQELAQPGRWSFPPRPARETSPDFRDQVRNEGMRIAKSPAMVCFRLPGGRVLAVRVADGSTGRRDGLFVVDPASGVPVAIYNFQGDGEEGIRWEPLGLLAERLRQWHAAGDSRERSAPALGVGFAGPRAFVDELLRGLDRGLRFLAEAPPAAGDELLPVFYDLDAVEATLSFTVSLSEGAPRAVLREEDADVEADEDADDVPSSSLRITVEPYAAPPRLTLELLELEFVLAGGDRRRAIGQIAEQAVEVDEAMDGGGQVRRWIEDKARQERAVVLRWFRRTERLLAIWPGAAGEELAFTCRRRGADIFAIRSVKASGAMPSLVDDVENDVQRYAPFHRFFQGVLAWQRRGV